MEQKYFEKFFEDTRKNVPILQVGGSSPASPTPSVIRKILRHTEQIVQRHNSSTVTLKTWSGMTFFFAIYESALPKQKDGQKKLFRDIT